MEMVRAYQGYFQNGQFMPLESVTIPENVEVFVMVTDRKMPLESTTEKLTPAQKAVAEDFLKALQLLRAEGFTEEDEAAINDLQIGKYKPTFDRRLDT